MPRQASRSQDRNPRGKRRAPKYYRKVLELRPGDENATRMLRQIGEP
jgi:hypothetical protein